MQCSRQCTHTHQTKTSKGPRSLRFERGQCPDQGGQKMKYHVVRAIEQLKLKVEIRPIIPCLSCTCVSGTENGVESCDDNIPDLVKGAYCISLG